MSYIVQRQDRFYVDAYDGLDPLTGRERRRWHPVGRVRDEAEAVAQRLDRERHGSPPPIGGPTTLGTFLSQTWLPRKRRQVRASTSYRYAWFVERYVSPVIGDVRLRLLRTATSRTSTTSSPPAAADEVPGSPPRPSSKST